MRYLSQSVRLKEAASPEVVRDTILTISVAIIAFSIWAAYAPVHEVARTPGEVIPSGYEQVVQHLEGGIIREIRVREGDTVVKGQVLLRIDGSEVQKNFDQARTQATLLDLQEERLRAFIEKRPPEFSGKAAADLAMIRDSEAFFESTVAARQKEREVVEKQISQKKHEIGILIATLATTRDNYAISSDLYRRRLELNRQGYLADIRLLEARQQYNQIEGQISVLKNQIALAQSAMQEYKARLASMSADQDDEAHRQLDGVLARKAQARELLEKLRLQIERLDVRAPVDGIVKGLAVNTIGSVVQPGGILMQIVPLKARLVVSLKIPPKYVGHIHPGQTVQLKFSSYDFSRYGSVEGHFASISATTFSGENGERYYQGKVYLAKDYVGSESNKILPGMTVMADIITGDKTILQYLLKPLQNAASTAFTER
jgi:HlyD family secretion protein/adhesin transport system membrane fusion protein